MNPEELDRIEGAHALDATPAAERDRIEEALAADPDRRAELDGFRATAATLGAAGSTPAPGGLRDRVLAEVAVTAQERTGPGRGDPSPSGSMADAVAIGSAPSRRAGGVPRWLGPALAAAAVVVAAGLGLLVGRAADDDGPAPVAAVLSDPAATVVDLDGLGDALRIVYSSEEGRGVVLADDLPVLDDDRTYELWVMDEGGPTSAGLFRPDADGRVEVVLDLAGVGGAQRLAVTNEPAGGSPGPTGDILATGELAA